MANEEMKKALAKGGVAETGGEKMPPVLRSNKQFL